MPSPSFVLTPTFDWSSGPEPAPAEQVPACAPAPAPKPGRRRAGVLTLVPAKQADRLRLRVAKLLAGRPAKRLHARGKLPQGVLTVLTDRLEAALAAGVIDPLPDDEPASTVTLTTGELRLLLRVLLAGDWPRLFPGEQPLVLPEIPEPAPPPREAERAFTPFAKGDEREPRVFSCARE